MNRFLWLKAARDAWLQLVVSSVLLVLFGWVFVWLSSLFRVGAMAAVLNFLPKFVEPLLGVPIADLATVTGRLTFLYVHVIVLLVVIGWAVGRGSDLVSGEIARGTMDLVLSLPVRRIGVLVSAGVVTAFGSAVLAVSVWLGNCIGVRTVTLAEPVDVARFLPGVLNLFLMAFCLSGVTTLFSSWGHDRWRTVLLAGGFFALESILKMIARLWEPGAWLRYLSFLTAFEPQRLILLPAEVRRPMAWEYDLTLLALGLACYLAAALVFTYRDIPQSR